MSARTIRVDRRCSNPACRARIRLSGPPQAGAPSVRQCPGCGQRFELPPVAASLEAGAVSRCLVCGGNEFFVRKDFPQRLGLILVALCGLLASYFYYREQVPATFVTLGALVVVDAVIYLFVGRVTVCYRCRAEYRGLPYNPRHQGFDLATSEKYG